MPSCRRRASVIDADRVDESPQEPDRVGPRGRCTGPRRGSRGRGGRGGGDCCRRTCQGARDPAAQAGAGRRRRRRSVEVQDRAARRRNRGHRSRCRDPRSPTPRPRPPTWWPNRLDADTEDVKEDAAPTRSEEEPVGKRRRRRLGPILKVLVAAACRRVHGRVDHAERAHG